MNPIGYFSNNPPTSFLPRKGGGGITDSIPSPHRNICGIQLISILPNPSGPGGFWFMCWYSVCR